MVNSEQKTAWDFDMLSSRLKTVLYPGQIRARRWVLTTCSMEMRKNNSQKILLEKAYRKCYTAATAENKNLFRQNIYNHCKKKRNLILENKMIIFFKIGSMRQHTPLSTRGRGSYCKLKSEFYFHRFVVQVWSVRAINRKGKNDNPYSDDREYGDSKIFIISLLDDFKSSWTTSNFWSTSKIQRVNLMASKLLVGFNTQFQK